MMIDALQWIALGAIWLTFIVWSFWAAFRYDWDYLQQRIFLGAAGIIVLILSGIIFSA